MKHCARHLLIVVALAFSIACTSSEHSPEASNENPTNNHCTEPENPYTEGTGHYAGYEWAGRNGSPTCSGSSQSFVEGCEEYEAQESQYEDCEARK
jgi:hypothetical protein